jgi:hypothetical protein
MALSTMLDGFSPRNEPLPPPLNEALILLLERREARLTPARLASAFADLEAKLDARFDAFDAKLDARFDAFEAKLDARFARFGAFEAKLDARFGNFEAKVTTTFAKVDAKLGAPHLLARTGIAPSIHIPSSTTT